MWRLQTYLDQIAQKVKNCTSALLLGIFVEVVIVQESFVQGTFVSMCKINVVVHFMINSTIVNIT